MNSNDFNEGIFLCTKAIFEVLEYLYKVCNDTALSSAMKILAKNKRLRLVQTNRFLIHIDDEKPYKKAEKILFDFFIIK